MTNKNTIQPRILAIDAGGTMTDTILVNEEGQFVVGKAQSNPEDESIAFINSLRDGLNYWNLTLEDAVPALASSIYSGTAMLNRLLERKGRKLGLIVTAGFEDYLRMERGIQTYLGYSYSDRLHLVTHRHNEPLVPRERIFGVRGRIDLFGSEQIPLYENEVREAVHKLIDMNVEGICVNLLHSYVNPEHEKRVKNIAQEIIRQRGADTLLFISSELYPVSQDFARLNTVLVEAYAADPSRDQFKRINRKMRELGANHELRVMASHGGTISTEAKELARTLVSGPIGGVVGAQYLAKELGFENVVCTDIGGTSFDLALITGGQFTIKTQPDIARFMLKLPLIEIDSVGAGTGSFVRLTPSSKRIEIGPDSAGYRIGVSNPVSGLSTVTINDCNVVLGYLNPDNFLGGDVKLDKERAYNAIKEQIADPLGLDVYEAAEGIISLFEDHLRNEVISRVLGKGYAPENYRLISYGGGGPVHVAGYTAGLNFEDILVPSWAAGFSAYGCACADYEYRSDKTVQAQIANLEDNITPFAETINSAWRELKDRVIEEFAKSGVKPDQVEFRHLLRVQYVGQLNDVEILFPGDEIKTAGDVQIIIDRFEEAYAKMYSRSARSPELGYLVTTAIITGVTESEKPKLPTEPLGPATPDTKYQETRLVYYKGNWEQANVYQMDHLRPGNTVYGFTIIESPNTTFVVPKGYKAYLDAHRIFHLSPE
ncbi:hydantoinase/oxoprolinase family protein [Thermoflavimicrobium dichotomicum]|uniref:N-methylhydantoinase A/acetone carboxylase, beta subunit n=1 Tax=Thermoflavimicrobium dichotomicum TaxID=46223 RepID=A0A1I3JGY7_9BACL|nr:hydantoinase/oxoprolinase family protein [Thermoflavimicrobium dichotomicum]SFI59185.1 N-methylhydantoinase A/acetone carboxylase, beta subunit [Thermoflavimicrobium dichotomicum]